jgi:hypothetical protein
LEDHCNVCIPEECVKQWTYLYYEREPKNLKYFGLFDYLTTKDAKVYCSSILTMEGFRNVKKGLIPETGEDIPMELYKFSVNPE